MTEEGLSSGAAKAERAGRLAARLARSPMRVDGHLEMT